MRLGCASPISDRRANQHADLHVEAGAKTFPPPTTLTTSAALGTEGPASVVRRRLPTLDDQSTLANTVSRPQPFMRRRAPAAAVSSGYAVAKVILNDMLAK